MSESHAPEPSEADERDLAARARATRVVVVGGGIAGLVAAWECARIGMPVTLVEAEDRLGGDLETDTLDGIAVDLVADALPLNSGALATLIDELGLRHLVEPAAADGIAIAAPGGPGGALRVTALPQHLVGIPANTWAEPVRRIVGAGGVWRAYLDRLRPPLTIGRQRSLGALVRARLGARVRDRLVAPLTVGLHGVEPELIDVDAAVPGLSAALTRAGSLAGAVDQLLPEGAAEHSHRATLRGGMSSLVSALADRLRDLDVDIRLGSRVTGLTRDGGGWVVGTSPDLAVVDGAANAPRTPVTPNAPDAPDAVSPSPAETAHASADVVVLASGARSAAALLAPFGVGVEVPPAPLRDVVTLVTDAAPRVDVDGSAIAIVCPVPGASAVAALVDVTAVWSSVHAAAGSDRRVLRVALVSDPAEPGGALESDEALVRRAHREAALLLGGGVGAVRASARRRVALAPPASALDHADRTAAARAAIARLDGVAAVGAWLSGAGVAAVVDDTIEEIEKVRRGTLFGARRRGLRPDDGPVTRRMPESEYGTTLEGEAPPGRTRVEHEETP